MALQGLSSMRGGIFLGDKYDLISKTIDIPALLGADFYESDISCRLAPLCITPTTKLAKTRALTTLVNIPDFDDLIFCGN